MCGGRTRAGWPSLEPGHRVPAPHDRSSRRGVGRVVEHRERRGAGRGSQRADPLYGIRSVLRSGVELLTERQHQRLTAMFATEQRVEVEATWGRSPPSWRGGAHVPDRADHPRANAQNVKPPTCWPTSTGPTPRRTDRSDQRPPRTPTRLRAGLPQPHQLHRNITTRSRRVQTTTTPSDRMSRQTSLRARAINPACDGLWFSNTQRCRPELPAWLEAFDHGLMA